MRRPLLAATAATAVVLALPTAAYAASVAFRSPTDGAVVAKRAGVAVEVEVQRSLGEAVQGVETRLRPAGGDPLPGIVPLDCLEPDGCDRIGDLDARWGGVALTPDADGYASGAVCNGAYDLEARPQGESGWPATTRVVLSAPPSHVAWLDAVARDRDVTLTWSTDATPDVRHVVERRPAGGTAWTERTVVAGTTGRFSETVAAGGYDYRVVAVRGDGMVEGAPAAPCTDTARDHVRASSVVAVTAAGASGTSSPAPTGSGGSGGTTDGGTGTTTDEAPSEGGGTADDGGTTTDATASGRRRVAAPPPAERSGTDTSAPALGDAPRAEDRYYGADEGYVDELDYDGVGPVPADEARQPVTAAGRLVSGGVQRVRDLDVDLPRILASMAGGATLIGAAFYLRRWSRGT